MIRDILVVCTGNICRSPMAQWLLQAKRRQGSVRSAGIAALVGYPADPTAIEVMSSKGYQIDAHRAQQLSRELLNDVDLVLALDQQHLNWINGRFPEYRGRVHKLLRWQHNADVPDPYKRSREIFENTFTLVESGVDDWLAKLELK